MSRRQNTLALVGLTLVVVGAWLQGRSQEADSGAVSAKQEEAYRENNIGVARLEQFDAKSAVESFRKALAAAPDLVIARVNLAIAHFYVPDLTAARTEAEAAAQGAPDRPQAHYVLGLIAKSENRIDEAKAAFERVLAIDPRDVGALVNLGQLEMQQRGYDAANALFERAVEAEPYNATAAYSLAVAFMRAGRRDEGTKAMARFQKLRESGVATTFSNAYLEQGRYAEAITSTGAEPGLVDEATPAVTFVASRDALPDEAASADEVQKAPSEVGAQPGGSVTLLDLDRDGDLDLLRAERDPPGAGGSLRAYANDEGQFSDVSERVGLGTAVASIEPFAAIGGDYDNDGRVDLFLLGAGGNRLLRQSESGRFEDETKTAKVPQPAGPHVGASFVDLDHDGDLDLALIAAEPRQPGAQTGARSLLLRNNGDGTFADITEAARVGVVAGAQVVPTDVDNRRDVDLLIVGSGQPSRLFRNMRDGTFQDVASELGLPTTPTSASAAADVNKDGFTDFFFGADDEGAAARGTLSLSTGDGSFSSSKSGPNPESPGLSQFLDYDNDGLLDLLVSTAQGFRLWRNLGARWDDVSEKALPAPLRQGAEHAGSEHASFATGDLDGDGDTDLVVRGADGTITVWRNEGGNANRSVQVRLTAQVSNRSAYGAKIEMRAGSLWQKLEYVSAWPASAPADISFGLGQRTSADVVRVLWPAGILQAEIPPAPAAADDTQVVSLTELDRKPSSCPYLFTWNGDQFEFVTDFLGGGEMGYLVAPGVFNTPDPIEYVRIRGDQLRARDGRYELRVTNELEETLYLDHARLVVVTHRADEEVYPNEGMTHTPKPFRLFAVRDSRVPARALDHAGRDVIDRIARLDRRFVDRLPLEKIRGYAKLHALTLDLSPSHPLSGTSESDGQLLLLTGWTDYAFSSDNLAAHQAGLALVPPSLQVKDGRGRWQTVIDNIGIPVGRPQTVPVDLTGKWLSDNREVRIVTSMRVYWDLIRLATPVSVIENETESEPLKWEQLDPVGARLAWRGFSDEAAVTADDSQPLDFDYDRVSFLSPWKVMRGRYTREGDVRPLLQMADDKFVVARPGDEIALSFDATALAPLPEGQTRTFLLYADGFSKEMDLNSASPDLTLPLPFHDMTNYPYPAPEAYPDTPAHRRYRAEYNTRAVGRPISPIETSMARR
ncbi:MAG: tetratricopeptide repeat protein [Luteitalea sp.]|nr:tetratricopeptide repeat protein [Luteitalea sp.]